MLRRHSTGRLSPPFHLSMTDSNSAYPFDNHQPQDLDFCVAHRLSTPGKNPKPEPFDPVAVA
ncbi:hypothetical protein L228DRAFT_250875 [Xylona heveae TC161]|uniref:Uncharacterized protein n=1 Tax=Xylona heveae (strain CBS 132557 / TC161) TaxID=1328760 RepID=A0A165A0N5_XYLHT|nr:hypothetical protein L228DRAFT_250875 [Xylona heveae TC161]KZF19787.1 hypothetical protein L228DRAFT_250875 [Xylona heveae TC161]